MTASSSYSIIQRVESFLNLLNHIFIGFITIYMSWFCIRLDLTTTALHAWLVTIGYCFLMAEAMMCLYDGNVVTLTYKRKTRTMIHWVLQLLGGGCGLVGCLIMMKHREFSFSTTHGKLGLATFVFCIISLLTGLIALFSQSLQHLLRPLFNKTFHNILGIVTFIIALLAQFYGYQSRFFKKKVTEDFEILMKVITIIVLLLTCIGPLKALYHKGLNIFSS